MSIPAQIEPAYPSLEQAHLAASYINDMCGEMESPENVVTKSGPEDQLFNFRYVASIEQDIPRD